MRAGAHDADGIAACMTRIDDGPGAAPGGAGEG